MTDLRVDLILRVESDHGPRRFASADAPGGELAWCMCGVKFKGEGALKKERRHRAEAILEALDEAAMVP